MKAAPSLTTTAPVPHGYIAKPSIDAAAGKPFDTSLLETLEGLAHRGYTEGFLRRHTHDDYQNYEHGYLISERQQFVGDFTGERKGPLAAVAVKTKFTKGDSSS